MDGKPGKRQDWNAPGHAHELTLSCFKRLKLFSEPEICRVFLSVLNEVRKELEFDVWAYVIMPEHVHLLVRSKNREYRIQDFRRDLKKRVGLKALAWIKKNKPKALARLSTKEGQITRNRFWQDGKGYDRNLWTPPLIWQSIRYIHGNPVKRGLCQTPDGWEWSSYRWFLKDCPVEFECDPCPVDHPNPDSGVWEVWWEPEWRWSKMRQVEVATSVHPKQVETTTAAPMIGAGTRNLRCPGNPPEGGLVALLFPSACSTKRAWGYS